MTAAAGLRNPWWVAAGCALALATSSGVVMSFAFSLFIEPVSAATGWSRSQVSAGYTVTVLLTALCSPLMGRALDRLGVRRVLIGAVAAYAACMAAQGLVAASLWSFLGLYALAGVFGAAHSPLPYAKVISAWFDRRRGLALGVAMAGIGVGGMVVPQIVRALLDQFDWRGAYLGLGATILAIALPAVLLLVRERPRRPEDGATTAAPLPGVERSQALRDRRFWALATAVFLTTMTLNGMAAHAVPMLTSHGASRGAAVAMLPALGLASLVGRLGAGYLLDRFFAPVVAAGAILTSLVGVFLLSTGGSPPLLVAGTVFLGVSLGAEVDVVSYLTSRYFGLKSFAEIYGYLVAVFSLSSGAGAALMAFSFDAAGGYAPALAGFAAALVLAAGLVLRLGPYAFPPEGLGEAPPKNR